MSRPPALPKRESFSGDDRTEYDYVYQRVTDLRVRTVEELPYVGACLNSPPFAASLWRFSGRMLAAGSTGDSFSTRDRVYTNVVLAFDSGHYQMVEGIHVEYATKHHGLRPEMVLAVWEGRDDDLAQDERQLVDYIRAYVNGTVSDEMWSGVVERFGSERAAVEYTLTIGYHLLVLRSMQAFAIPSMSRDEMDQTVRRLQTGGDPDQEKYAAHDRALRELHTEMSAG